MKFTWKMILLVAILLALTLSVSGYLVIRSSFRSGLDAELADARENARMFSLTVQALYLDDLRYDNERSALQSLQNLFPTDGIRVTDADGKVLTQTSGLPAYTFGDLPSGVLETRIVREDGKVFILCLQRVTVYDSVFYLTRAREITDIFQRAEAELNRYSLIMALVLVIGVGLTTALTFYLTRPIRRISRVAKQFSGGRYEKRVTVRSHDELGQLAQTFNDMADSIEAKINELADAAQRQKDFTASFAHELKTPLTSVIGYADTLRSRVLPAKKQLEAANYIFSEGKRLESMSFALLDLFALEREAPQFRDVTSEKLVQDAAESCAFLLKEKRLRLQTRVENRTLNVAPELILIVLYNLIDNARKASEPGGEIWLHARETENGFRFSVRDQGRGIPPEALARLTEPFYMVDKSRARQEGGSGLGLALCQRIAQAHGSRLTIESEEGRGTVIGFTLPYAPAAGKEAAP